MPVLPLSVLCENILLQNYLALKDLGDTRFQLIQRVLFRFNPQQLIELESSNPRLMLDDESVWLSLVKKEFPQDVHERYTTNSSKIKDFFKQQLDEVCYDYSNINLDNYISYQQLGNTKKYKLPSKLLYLKYREDYLKKEELAIENLRQRMKAIQKDKEENRVVHIDDVIPEPNARVKSIAKPQRSKIFMKSKIEAKQRQTLFKNPLRMSIEGKAPVIRPPRKVPTPFITKPSSPRPKPILTSPTRSKPISPIRPKPQSSSVFHNKRVPRLKPAQPSSPIRSTTVSHTENTSQPTENIPSEAPRKKINIGEYKARKM